LEVVGECPLWVKNGHFGTFDQCPLIVWKRASLGTADLSAGASANPARKIFAIF